MRTREVLTGDTTVLAFWAGGLSEFGLSGHTGGAIARLILTTDKSSSRKRRRVCQQGKLIGPSGQGRRVRSRKTAFLEL